MILVIGDVAVDRTLTIDRSLSSDEKHRVLLSARSLGGTGLNVASQLARLGVPVVLSATVGDDPEGSWIRDRLTAEGVPHELAAHPGHSLQCTIVLDRGERELFVDAGVGTDLVLPREETLAKASLLFVSYSPRLVVELVRRGFGDRLVVGAEAWMSETAGFAEALDAARLTITNAAGRVFTSSRRGTVVVTDGGAPVTIWRKGRLIDEVPTQNVVVTDATGAGDAFAGALLARLAEGSPLRDAVRAGTHAGAAVAELVGARAGQLDCEGLERRMSG